MIPERCPGRQAFGLPGLRAGRIILLTDALDPCPQAGGMPPWRPMVSGACWRGRRDAPTQTCSSLYRSRCQCRLDVRSWRAQVGSAMLPLFTEATGDTGYTRDVCLVSCGFFLVCRRSKAPEFPRGLRINRRVTSTTHIR